METESLPTPDVQLPKQKNTVLLILVIILGLSTLILASILFLKLLARPKTASVSTPSPIIVLPTSIPTINPTIDWKTYTNTDFQFLFRYPNNFKAERIANDSEYSFQVVVKDTESSQISFDVSGTNKYLPGDLQYYLDSQSVDQQEIAGEIWDKYYLPNGYGDGPEVKRPSILAFRIERNSILYTLHFTNQRELNEIQRQILSTFKFLASVQKIPTNIPTPTIARRKISYRNLPGWPLYLSPIDFSFQYPPDYSSPTKGIVDFMNNGQFYCAFYSDKKVGTGLDSLYFNVIPKNYEDKIQRTLKILNAPGYLNKEEVEIYSYPATLLELDQSYKNFKKDQALVIETESMLLIGHYQQNEINPYWNYILESIRFGPNFNKEYFDKNLNNCRNE